MVGVGVAWLVVGVAAEAVGFGASGAVVVVAAGAGLRTGVLEVTEVSVTTLNVVSASAFCATPSTAPSDNRRKAGVGA